MAVIQGPAKQTVKKKLGELEGNIKLAMFTQEMECHSCVDVREMIEELTGMSPKIEIEIHDFVRDAKLARKFGVNKIPAVVLLGDKDYGIRFFGVPAGYELAAFIEAVINVSKGRTDLPEDVKQKLAGIRKKVDIKVLVTPTCPFCAMAVQTASKLAIENDNITSSIVEIVEFPEIAQRYSAMSVPKIVINEVVDFAGAQPASYFVEEIMRALRSGDNPMYS